MQKIFRSAGVLRTVKDAVGDTPKNDWARAVVVDVKYELRPSPHQPLIVDVYGYNLFGFGQSTEELKLDNGVVFTGRTRGGSLEFNTGELRRVRMFDIEQRMLRLYPDRADLPDKPTIDTVVLGLVSSETLGSSGWARPGLPFSYTEGKPPEAKANVTWCSGALQMEHAGLELTFVATSNYWKQLVDEQSLLHETICGIRKAGGGTIGWGSVDEMVYVLSNFLGWVNHCVAPIFHIKAYLKGRLVYRDYDLYPHPTVQRDQFSWLPRHGGTSHRDTVQKSFNAFAETWKKSADENGTFHLALQLLRSEERGSSPRSSPSLLYLRDTFGAVAILTSMLVGSNPNRGRVDTMVQCLKSLGISDQLPIDDVREDLKRGFAHLWRSADSPGKPGSVQENERDQGTLCRPVANVGNWLLHLEDTQNAHRLLSLRDYQAYFVEVSTWIADLTLMKVVGYQGSYFNRLTREVEILPWEKQQLGETGHPSLKEKSEK